jgi:Predicted hydrolases or acyltransferases (alpha/beta hydrolase superfamily)
MKWEEWISLGNYISVQGIKTFYVERGKGKTLLFLHGWGASSYSWRNNFLFLCQAFHAIAIDLKGFGLTEKPKGNYDLNEFTEHVKKFIDLLGLEKVSLVGNSMGGSIAINLAYNYDKVIDRVILINSTVIANNNSIPFLFRIISIKPIGELLSFFMINKRTVVNTLNQVYYNKDKINEESIDGYYKPLKLKGTRRVLLNSLRNISKFNISDYLEKLNKKFLIIWGEKDPWLPVEHAYIIHKKIKNSKLIIIPETGHVPHEEKPEIVNEAIINFMNE